MGLQIVLFLIPPLLTSVYTINYGRWAGRKGNARGAFGLYALAAIVVLLPGVIMWFRLRP